MKIESREQMLQIISSKREWIIDTFNEANEHGRLFGMKLDIPITDDEERADSIAVMVASLAFGDDGKVEIPVDLMLEAKSLVRICAVLDKFEKMGAIRIHENEVDEDGFPIYEFLDEGMERMQKMLRGEANGH